MTLLPHLLRGAQAGVASGALVAAFGLALAEPVIDRAVELESARQAAAGSAGELTQRVEVFSRDTQHVGFVVAALLTGLALGVLFGALFAALHSSSGPARDPWRSSLRLAAGGMFAVVLVPFVRYPANPPGVGDPNSVDTRTAAYLGALCLGLLGVFAASRLARTLRARDSSEPVRQLAVAGVLLGTVALTFALPGGGGPPDVPAQLLWEFRLLALVSSLLLWAGLGVVFGLLVDGPPWRASRRPGSARAAPRSGRRSEPEGCRRTPA